MNSIFRFFMPIIIAAVVLFAIGVGMQNSTERVTLQLLIWEFSDLPLILVLIESIAFGMVTAIFIYAVNEILLRKRLWHQKKEIKRLKEEVKALQNFPLTDEAGSETPKD
ncbi:LapA family protein [candidate division TA06 bacterium]|nr:LapA family protein [candidate division TA06 bacterium]